MLWFQRRKGSLCDQRCRRPSLAMGHPTAAPAADRPLPFASRRAKLRRQLRWRARQVLGAPLTTYELAIEGRDQWLAAARRLA